MPTTTRVALPINTAQVPVGGGVGMPDSFVFSGGLTQINRDYNLELMQGVIDFFQSVWIDNSLNNATFRLQAQGLNQIIQVGVNSQGMFPLLMTQGLAAFVAITSVTGSIVPVIFFNTPQPPAYWKVA